MGWLRVESAFPNHRKIHAAGEALGGAGRGRVLALWMLGAAYAVDALRDGFVPFGVMEDKRFDLKPLEVIAAMVKAGLLHRAPGGYQIHDFNDYNPRAADIIAKRKADLARKHAHGAKVAPDTAEKSPIRKTIPRGIRVESAKNRSVSEAIPNGAPAEKVALARAPARARSDPDPQDQKQDQEQRENRAQRLAESDANYPVLLRLCHDCLKSGFSFDRIGELNSEIKTRAAKARIDYGPSVLDAVLKSAEFQTRRH